MTYREALLDARARLEQTETPYLDALVLLTHAAGTTKERLLAALPEEIDPVVAAVFDECVNRRLRGEPVSYIRNRKEFWGLEFYVDRRVLVPRPDTEILVDEVLALLSANARMTTIHDACTGSGCIAVALKYEHPAADVSVSDISAAALEVADFNARSILGAPLPAVRSDLLASVEGTFDLITCNPPYVEHDHVEKMTAEGWPEPVLALDGGKDGFDLIPRLLSQALDRLNQNGYLLVEASPQLVPRIARSMSEAGYREVRSLNDLAGRSRVALGRRE